MAWYELFFPSCFRTQSAIKPLEVEQPKRRPNEVSPQLEKQLMSFPKTDWARYNFGAGVRAYHLDVGMARFMLTEKSLYLWKDKYKADKAFDVEWESRRYKLHWLFKDLVLEEAILEIKRHRIYRQKLDREAEFIIDRELNPNDYD
jgi:hypothetical protein